ncbi:hypothetical protein MAUB1S_11434 [Mycolicibacterium aubagnense]
MSLKPVSFKKGRQSLPRLSKPYVPGKRDARYWTDDEKEIVQKYYPLGGASACLAHLSGKRTATTVYQMAVKLGLANKQNPERHTFTPEEDETIRSEWALLSGRKKGEVSELADRLRLPRHLLSQRARKLGLTIPHKKEKAWTSAEDALMSKVPLHDPDRCAEIFRENGFNRTPTAIMVRSKRVNLSRRFNIGLSAHAAAKIIGVDSKGVTAYCISGDLKASKRNDSRLPQQGGSRWVIKPVDLRQFVIDNIGRIDFRKVDKFELVRLLTTEGSASGDRRSGWTVAEDNIIKGGYARRLTQVRLIDELEASGFKRRSVTSISMRAKFLGCLSERASEEWTPREDAILKQAYDGGVRIADIVGLLEDEGFKRTRGAIQMRAIVLRISTDRVNYWTEEEKKIALDGLRAGKSHGAVREDLAAAGFIRGPTAMFKFAQKHRVVRKAKEFTEVELAQIRSMFGEGRSHGEIAAKLDRTHASVAGMCSKMGLKHRRPWTEAERQTLVDYQASGRKLKDAAVAIGRPYVNVCAEAGRMGLSFMKPSTERNPT